MNAQECAIGYRWIFLSVLSVAGSLAPARAADEGRTKTRLLYDFEDASDVKRLLKGAENVTLTTVEDVGVTHGSKCARLTAAKGAEYAVLQLDAEAIKDWGDFDYFAVDVTLEDDHPYQLVLELWDGASKNYATRCTFEGVTTRPGRQTLLYPIEHARRNAKEGLDWGELEDKDKIDRDALTQVKLFLTPLKDRDAVMWIDNVRLMQEDAAKPKLTVPLPAGADRLQVRRRRREGPRIHDRRAGCGVSRLGRGRFRRSARNCRRAARAGRTAWPARSSLPPEDGRLEFRARVPNGDYLVWLCAGPVIRKEYAARHFLLRANDEVLFDDLPPPIPVLQPQIPVSVPEYALFREAPCPVGQLHRPDVPGPHAAREGDGRHVHAGGRELFRQRRGAGPRVGQGRLRQVRGGGPQAAHRGVREDAAAAARQEAAAEAGRRRRSCSTNPPSARRSGRGRGRRPRSASTPPSRRRRRRARP